ncbi:hypothetical protein AVEN_9574-1 [Araneus ventricosus]|uniref:Uncharacterized protein n=1 Tax=Araneus ventricosus TaxID=182803 RepID=A0A4Y2H5B0_ARAVE|nr:hypothetical protein AVEN_9574-1 [Araneus ventricosus]
MPDPSPSEGDSSSKDKYVSITGIKSFQKNPADSQSKVGGVNTVEHLFNQITDFNFDLAVSGDLIAPLQELIKIFINKSREIKAGVRQLLNEKVIVPLVKFIQGRETTHLSNIYDLKSRYVDVNVRQYQAKIRECESTIEYLRGKRNIVNTELVDYKQDSRDSSKSLLETTKEVRSIIAKATPSLSEILQSRPVAPIRAPVSIQRDNHVVLLRPKKESLIRTKS